MKVVRTVLNGSSVEGMKVTFVDYRLEDGEDIDEFLATMREMLGVKSEWTITPGGVRVIERYRDQPVEENATKKRKGR